LEYATKSNGKIKVFAPINRDQLLTSLSSMDFVVNFENVGSKQTPSKLIDYAIIKKPILSIRTGDFNEIAATQFLGKSYETALEIENLDRYKIENVVMQFTDLVKTI
jgi:bifunctional ADP-heptose synthase (sugar kinase/adenylyltransferase)